jgi:hypothetical protein
MTLMISLGLWVLWLGCIQLIEYLQESEDSEYHASHWLVGVRMFVCFDNVHLLYSGFGPFADFTLQCLQQ